MLFILIPSFVQADQLCGTYCRDADGIVAHTSTACRDTKLCIATKNIISEGRCYGLGSVEYECKARNVEPDDQSKTHSNSQSPAKSLAPLKATTSSPPIIINAPASKTTTPEPLKIP